RELSVRTPPTPATTRERDRPAQNARPLSSATISNNKDAFIFLQTHGLEFFHALRHSFAPFFFHRNHAFFRQISLVAPGSFTGEFCEKFLNRRNNTDVGFFDVEIQRPRYRIAAVSNGFKLWFHTIDGCCAHYIGVLIEKTETENAEQIGIFR